MVHSDEGLRELYLDVARKLADRGFLTVVGCRFTGRALAVKLREQPLPCNGAPTYEDGARWAEVMDGLIQGAARERDGKARPIGLIGYEGGAIEALRAADDRTDVAAIVAISAAYAGIREVPDQPLLMVHGTISADPSEVQSAARYEELMRQRGGLAKSVTFNGRYHFLLDDTSTQDGVVDEAARFLREHVPA
jgi:dienelactone hydrolase